MIKIINDRSPIHKFSSDGELLNMKLNYKRWVSGSLTNRQAKMKQGPVSSNDDADFITPGAWHAIVGTQFAIGNMNGGTLILVIVYGRKSWGPHGFMAQ